MAIEIGDFVPVCAFGSELAAAKQRWLVNLLEYHSELKFSSELETFLMLQAV